MESSDELSDFLNYYREVVRVLSLTPWDRSARRAHAWVRLVGRTPRNGEPDPPRVAEFLRATESNLAMQQLAATPYYADLLARTFGDGGVGTLQGEVALVERAVREMGRREYQKGTLREDVLPLDLFLEWLEELAVLGYEGAGFSAAQLRELADLITVFVVRELSEEEQRALIEQITMGPFLTRSAASGRLQLTHEILAEFLAGRRFAREFRTNPGRFASRLSRRAWPADSILFPLLADALGDRIEDIAGLGVSEGLSADGRRNLIQLVATMPNGERVFQAGKLLVEGARLEGVRFQGLDLRGVSFRRCDLSGAVFDKCRLDKNLFEGARFRNTAFLGGSELGLASASFGDFEHFESVVVEPRRRFDDYQTFLQWARGAEGGPDVRKGPCATARQILHLFGKYIHLDGQGRRDAHEYRSLLRGRREPGAPPPEECVKAAVEFGYLVRGEFSQVRRPTGPKYGEMVAFVKDQTMSEPLRSLLDALCHVPGCRHAGEAGRL
jgi:hypothetical protein